MKSNYIRHEQMSEALLVLDVGLTCSSVVQDDLPSPFGGIVLISAELRELK
jgi:hypothetical protein